MALTDIVVRQAKATGKHYTLGDFDGLSLFVSAQGYKTWHFRYGWLGNQKRLSLGPYPQIGLRDARTLRDEARALLAREINPKQHRDHQRQADQCATEYTFEAVFEKWLQHRRLSLKEGRQRTASLIPRIFANDILPALHKRTIYGITRADLLEVVGRIERRKAFSVAEKVRTWLNQLFRYALVIVPGLERNPASDLDVVAVPQPPVRHNPFLRMPRLSHCCLFPTQDLAALVSSANAASPRPPLSVLRRPDHEMPKLPVVRSRQSRVSGQPSQVAGALIPDNTQQPWRDE